MLAKINFVTKMNETDQIRIHLVQLLVEKKALNHCLKDFQGFCNIK